MHSVTFYTPHVYAHKISKHNTKCVRKVAEGYGCQWELRAYFYRLMYNFKKEQSSFCMGVD